VAQAFEKRPELKLAQNAIEQSEINLKFAKSQRMPQLDLVGRYGYVGISGRPNSNFQIGNIVPPNAIQRRDYSDGTQSWFQGTATTTTASRASSPSRSRTRGVASRSTAASST